MWKYLSLAAATSLLFSNALFAQVEAPREVNQERGRGAQEREVETRAGNRTLDNTGVVNGARRRQPGSPVQAPINTGGAILNGPTTIQANRPVGNDSADLNSQLNSQLADCFLLHNQSEINLARYALETSQNPQVKEFAQHLIDDHEKFAEQLQQYAQHHQKRANAQTNDNQNPATNPEGITKRILNDRVEVKVGFGGSNHLSNQWYQIEQEATENCERMSRELLSKEKGADFDKCFVGMQIGSHIGMISHLKAAEKHASGDFQKVLQDASNNVSRHYEHAMTLKNELMAAK